MQKQRFQSLLEAVDEEESLESCDRLTRGEVNAEVVDAQLQSASARVQALRSMSEPLSADVLKQLGDILERPARQPVSLVGVEAVAPVPLRPRVKRSVYATRIGIGLALAAGVAALAIPRFFRDAALPEFALETAEHNAQVLGGPAVASGGVIYAKKGSCLELTLRPKKRYQGALSTQIFLIPKSGGAPPVGWPATLYQTESGTLRQEGTCAKLPPSVERGDWRIVVTYGSQLPDAAKLNEILTHAPAGGVYGNGWAAAEQTLQLAK